MPNQGMMNPGMMNPGMMNPQMYQMQMQQMQQMQKLQQMQQMQMLKQMKINNSGQGQTDKRMSRIMREYSLCEKDGELVQIGCSFGLFEPNNYNIWKVTMVGPQNTAYAGGVFTIKIIFPPDYPNKGAEFKFINKIYHLNVDFGTNDPSKKGHICLSTLNEWATTGHVKSKPCYGVKQALFDIFCLFYNQGVESPYDEAIAKQYRDKRAEFDALARDWTSKYASMNG